MEENMNKKIQVPLLKEDIDELRAGDYVYLTGTIYTARDAAHKRMYDSMKKGEELPIELSEPIEKEPLLCYIFETWCQREKNATLNWVNHRGGTPKAPKTKTTPPPAEPTIEDVVIEETPFGKIELSGIKKNMPSSNDDFRAIASVVGDEFNNFIGYGNVVEW